MNFDPIPGASPAVQTPAPAPAPSAPAPSAPASTATAPTAAAPQAASIGNTRKNRFGKKAPAAKPTPSPIPPKA